MGKSFLICTCLLLEINTAASFASAPYGYSCENNPVTMGEVETAQQDWADAIVRISNTHLSGGDVKAVAEDVADKLYGYGRTNVLFKPTKAAEHPFRPTGTGALSYFVGGDKIPGGYDEDKGFALGPDGVGWKAVTLGNHQVEFNGATAQAMGEYFFTSAADNSVSKVEYTFGYKRNPDCKIRIYLHHSSVPYPLPNCEEDPITMGEVQTAQQDWADAIKAISYAHLNGGNVVTEAEDAAAKLYSYNYTAVLFKPTKAAEYPFRPTGTGALSYFVGGDKIVGGYDEDKGFALGPDGVGWSEVTLTNHQVIFNGATAQAMGEYFFTSAADSSVTKVEYTFGYKRNPDCKIRIYLHHSSRPYFV